MKKALLVASFFLTQHISADTLLVTIKAHEHSAEREFVLNDSSFDFIDEKIAFKGYVLIKNKDSLTLAAEIYEKDAKGNFELISQPTLGCSSGNSAAVSQADMSFSVKWMPAESIS